MQICNRSHSRRLISVRRFRRCFRTGNQLFAACVTLFVMRAMGDGQDSSECLCYVYLHFYLPTWNILANGCVEYRKRIQFSFFEFTMTG